MRAEGILGDVRNHRSRRGLGGSDLIRLLRLSRGAYVRPDMSDNVPEPGGGQVIHLQRLVHHLSRVTSQAYALRRLWTVLVMSLWNEMHSNLVLDLEQSAGVGCAIRGQVFE